MIYSAPKEYSMAIRGQRFHIDLSSENEIENPTPDFKTAAVPANVVPGLVADIQERTPSSDPKPPSLPANKSSPTGFPPHRKRTKPSSVWTQRQRQPATDPPTTESARPRLSSSRASKPEWENSHGTADAVQHGSPMADEARAIDEENKQRMAQMSSTEIEEARRELLTGLRPSLIERLLKKANIEEDVSSNPDPPPQPQQPSNTTKDEQTTKAVGFDRSRYLNNNLNLTASTTFSPTFSQQPDPDLPPAIPPPDLFPASSPLPAAKLPPGRHAAPPALDPSAPTFLSDLHSTYFPALPSNPSSLAWMRPPTPSETTYRSSLPSLPPSALRFDFHGRLLPPRLSSQIPTSQGLHHHGAAPDAAGYTIPELAHLARSSVASQRCVAFQTLGRLLYRLGTGVFGREGEHLCEGLWELVDHGNVLDLLVAEAGRGQGGNRSSWATATEAVWLWRKGGGRRWKAE